MSTEQFNAHLRPEDPPVSGGRAPRGHVHRRVTFHWNGDEIRVYHVPPAHTDGDSIVHFVKANVVHMGDVFFNGSYPFVDTSSGGADRRRDRGRGARPRRHRRPRRASSRATGRSGRRADLQAYRDVLKTLRDRVAKLKADGKSRDEVVAAKPTADHDAKWGDGLHEGRRLRRPRLRLAAVAARAAGSRAC